MTERKDPINTEDGSASALHKVGFARGRTELSMAFERLLPRLLPSIAIITTFIAAIWLGLFRLLPLPMHYVALAIFGMALFWALAQLRHFRWPSASAINARLEAHNQLSHTPLRVQTDTLPQGSTPLEQALWREHQTRMAKQINALEAPRPNARIAPKPSYLAYTALAGLTVVALAFSRGPSAGHWGDILTEPAMAAAAAPRLDLWVTPPDYTGLPPVFIKADQTSQVLDMPLGSIVTLRVSGSFDETAIALIYAAAAKPATSIASEEAGLFQLPLQQSGLLTVTNEGEALQEVAFNVIADEAPTIAWNGPITVNRNGSFELNYTAEDDYGIRAAKGVLAFNDPTEAAEPLYPMPEMDLRVPSNAGINEGQSRIALGDHPLANIPMMLTLEAEDALTQKGQSEARLFTLPQRPFYNPVAKALVEQRRLLARDKNTTTRIKRLMEAMMLHPEATIDDTNAFLGVRTAYQRLRMASTDDELRGVADYLWEIALTIEQGQMSNAEQRLQAARDALREAIENGASEEEIAAKTQELREALSEYLQELARQSEQNPNQQAQNGQEMEAQDLNKMLDQIEDLAQQGAQDQAEQLLSQLDQILDNLQAGQHSAQQGDGQQGEMQQRMNELGEIMREQQELMDQTFSQQQQGEQGEQGQDGQQGEQGQQGQQGQQPGQSMQGLQQGQQGLQQRLQEFGKALEGMGINPGEGFGKADQSMGQASDSLGQGDSGSATGQQSDALQALREGAGEMMQQMQQAMQGQQGGSNPQQAQQGQMRDGQDPLGRQQGGTGPQFNSDVKVPDEIDMQRAREILNAIRRRLGDSAAPNSEKDYLERLLDFNQ